MLPHLVDAIAWNWERMFIAAAAMVGAVLLSLPLAFLYLRTKPAHEFDSSVLFSIVFLAATIAGIMVVVQGSIARALSLAGVVTAVRFRSSLKDSNDAVYLLGAIAVGFAAGSNALDVGVVISALLSVTLLLLWKVRLDAVKRALLPKDHESRHGHHHRDPDLPEPSVERSMSPAADGNGEGPSSMPELRPQALARLGYRAGDGARRTNAYSRGDVPRARDEELAARWRIPQRRWQRRPTQARERRRNTDVSRSLSEGLPTRSDRRATQGPRPIVAFQRPSGDRGRGHGTVRLNSARGDATAWRFA